VAGAVWSNQHRTRRVKSLQCTSAFICRQGQSFPRDSIFKSFSIWQTDRTQAHVVPASSDGSSPILGFKERSRILTMLIMDSTNDGIPLARRSEEHIHYAVDAPSINALKKSLEKISNNWMGFFLDQSLSPRTCWLMIGL